MLISPTLNSSPLSSSSLISPLTLGSLLSAINLLSKEILASEVFASLFFISSKNFELLFRFIVNLLALPGKHETFSFLVSFLLFSKLKLPQLHIFLSMIPLSGII